MTNKIVRKNRKRHGWPYKMVTAFGVTASTVDWADALEVKTTTLNERHRRGWDHREIITTPVLSRPK